MARKVTPVEGSLGELLIKTLTNRLWPGWVKVDGVVLPEAHTEIVDAIENFKVRDDDVWVCSFPKSGTTWTQEMVWGIANDMDSEEIKLPLGIRFPRLEKTSIAAMEQHEGEHLALNCVKIIENLPSPRFIKSHLPFRLLPREIRTGVKKPKIVYVARNPKDVCISYFNFLKLYNFKGNFDEFCALFIGDTIPAAPFWDHVLGYWTRRTNENILFIKYEDMKKNLPDVINKTARFLGRNLTSDKLSTLSAHLSFDRMKANPAVNYQNEIAMCQIITGSKEKGEFMRNGNVDQWKTVMTPENIKRFDDWTSECSKGTGLHF